MTSTNHFSEETLTLLRAYVDFYSPHAQHRTQQEEMTVAVAYALSQDENLVCQAGTGTGKSLGYLAAIYATHKRTVIATATKALSEQLVETDIPALDEFLIASNKKPLSYALLKGRSNYACQLKLDAIRKLGAEEAEAHQQDELDLGLEAPDEPAIPMSEKDSEVEEYKALLEWADETSTGDRSDAPPASDWAWNQISVTAAGCLGASNCPFADQCFSEIAREQARIADVTVTNHALLAADMKNDSPLFGGFDAVVVDEVHDFEKSLSNAWGAEVSPSRVTKAIKGAAKTAPGNETVKAKTVDVLTACESLEKALEDCEPGSLKVLDPAVSKSLSDIQSHIAVLALDLGRLAEASEGAKAGRIRSAAQDVRDLGDAIEMCLDDSPATVRWLDIRNNGDATIKTSPLDVGSILQKALGNRSLIATSATCSVGGSFDYIINALKLPLSFRESENGTIRPRPYQTLDVGTPFDWKTSAMLYIPAEGFPEPVGKDRIEHTEAVLEEVEALARAAGGRTLFLSTTMSGAIRAAAHLKAALPVNVYGPEDGTAGQLADWFIEDETSILCATMGMWAGLSPVGPTCSLVVIDKIPFPPMDDPLTKARTEAVDERGGSGFMEVSVGHAGLMLAQGAGRLIRSASDRGVVAILDRRLATKRYGTALLRSIPPTGQFTDREQVEAALTRLTGGLDPNATVKKAVPRPKPQRKAKSSGSGRKSGVTAQTRSRKASSFGKGAKSPITRSRQIDKNDE